LTEFFNNSIYSINFENMMQHKVYDLKALDVDTSKRVVKVAFAELESKDRDGDIFEPTAFDKSIREKGPSGSNEIWHLINHEKKLQSALGKFSNVYREGKYIVGENSYRDMWLWKEVAWPLYEKGDITQHSVGFNIIKEHKAADANIITEVQLWEGSAVLWGANPNTPTLDVAKSIFKEKSESAADYMGFVIKNLQEGKYSGENESLLILELKEMSALLLPKETSQEPEKPNESSLDLQKLKTEIELLTLKHFYNGK
jgi:HK97 family phage prohead protease